LAEATLAAGVPVVMHVFLDGRDGPPRAAKQDLAAFEEWRRGLPLSSREKLTLGTVMGRYWSMDRDRRMDRTQAALDAILAGQGRGVIAATDALMSEDGECLGDEFVPPAVLRGYVGASPADGWLMANFRPDRIRQLWRGILDAGPWSGAVTMASVGAELDPLLSVLMAPESVLESLGEVVSSAGRTQWRVSESEKYAHVTYFLNGGREAPWPGEARLLIPSPSVAHYAEAPGMAAEALTDSLVAACEDRATLADLTVINYANADMVGHTGSWDAACEALRVLDRCFGRLAEIARVQSIDLCITADHGNIECMVDPETGMPHTAHTTGPVPCVVWSARHPRDGGWSLRSGGSLADMAPTVLDLLGISVPRAMTGRSLLVLSDKG
jgi:2,3-bisphosphoglycerate-independent phosphoglycerate mutase